MSKDSESICISCLAEIPGDEAKLVDLVIYCPRCAKEYKEDAEIQALLDNYGPSC